MAVFETSRALTEGARFNPTTLFTRIAGAVMAWNDRRMTRNALSSLTARELEDIGLSRGDIANM
ncbi:DUF1127 domain-containing protein [uncultured Litoreibacter sp.]|uniref:DUF1127 domain-containing protein n=1 Tax=uncultured Litoreibacter sp. TaxID=1392394 RepID=UPI00262605DA|nr:DUF1127 domain-containing protein [uncultured Litoreibacter sp.]